MVGITFMVVITFMGDTRGIGVLRCNELYRFVWHQIKVGYFYVCHFYAVCVKCSWTGCV